MTTHSKAGLARKASILLATLCSMGIASTAFAGAPVKGITVKGGKNPGGNYVSQNDVANSPNMPGDPATDSAAQSDASARTDNVSPTSGIGIVVKQNKRDAARTYTSGRFSLDIDGRRNDSANAGVQSDTGAQPAGRMVVGVKGDLGGGWAIGNRQDMGGGVTIKSALDSSAKSSSPEQATDVKATRCTRLRCVSENAPVTSDAAAGDAEHAQAPKTVGLGYRYSSYNTAGVVNSYKSGAASQPADGLPGRDAGGHPFHIHVNPAQAITKEGNGKVEVGDIHVLR